MPVIGDLHGIEMINELRQVFQLPPEPVKFPCRFVDPNGFVHSYSQLIRDAHAPARTLRLLVSGGVQPESLVHITVAGSTAPKQSAAECSQTEAGQILFRQP